MRDPLRWSLDCAKAQASYNASNRSTNDLLVLEMENSSTSTTPRQSGFRVVAAGALLALATIVVYFPSMHGGFLFDDDQLLTNNPLIKAPNGLFRCWYTTHQLDYLPLTISTLWLEWRLWGMDPTGYRVTNLLLHIAACFLIWTVLRRLSIPGGFLAALLFAVHPVNVESVAWIEQRKSTLSLVLFLLSILWYPIDEPDRETRKHASALGVGRWYWLSLMAFTLAMFSKGSAAILPFVLLLIVWWRRDRITKPDVLRSAPFFLVAAVFTPIIIWFVAHGATTTIRELTFGQRAACSGTVVWFYLCKALIPIRLLFVYPQWQIDADNLLWCLPLLASFVITAELIGRQNHRWIRPILFAWASYCIGLRPVLGFTDPGYMSVAAVADHYQYISLISITALAGAAWYRWHQHARNMILTMTAATTAVGILMFLTWQQSQLYADPIVLYEATLEHNPDCYFIHNNLGAELAKSGRSQNAIGHFQKAIRLKPDYALAHFNLGETLLASGRAEGAIEHYRQAVRFQPDFTLAYHNLGNALRDTGHIQEAIESYERAIALAPAFATAHFNLGIALMQEHQIDKAIEQFRLGLHFDPDNAAAHHQLGNALRAAHQPQEAVDEYLAALRLKPDDAEAQASLEMLLSGRSPAEEPLHNVGHLTPEDRNAVAAQFNLGIAQLHAGHPEKALEFFERALSTKSDIPEVQSAMGAALVIMGRSQPALEHLQIALRLRPDDADAQNNLASALGALGRTSEAVEHCREAVRLRPAFIEPWNNLVIFYDQLRQPEKAVAAAEKVLDLARSQGKTALAEQMEDWLAAHRGAIEIAR